MKITKLITCKNLLMLLAPKTLWAMVNLNGSVGGKYGAKTHFSPHRRRRILQAAHGLSTTGGGEGGRSAGEDWEGDIGKVDGELEKGVGLTVLIGVSGGDVVLPLYSIFSRRKRKRGRERERIVRLKARRGSFALHMAEKRRIYIEGGKAREQEWCQPRVMVIVRWHHVWNPVYILHQRFLFNIFG